MYCAGGYVPGDTYSSSIRYYYLVRVKVWTDLASQVMPSLEMPTKPS
jgi:hypothetical protein